MKYRLTEDWLEYKKGHVFENGVTGEILRAGISGTMDSVRQVTPIELSLLLKTGILEEVKEEEWPKDGEDYWIVDTEGRATDCCWENDYIDENRKKFGNVFRSEIEAKEASEKIKTLLLSLKK